MVDGTAYKPFVHRTLLPSTVRIISLYSPENLKNKLSALVDDNAFARKIFENLKWESSAAWMYLIACILMWLSFVGFAHFSSGLIIHTCGIQETPL
jgi:hypothetical protein